MNHMVVNFMKEDQSGRVALHASEKALQGNHRNQVNDNKNRKF